MYPVILYDEELDRHFSILPKNIVNFEEAYDQGRTICRHFKNGYCKNGENCTFHHVHGKFIEDLMIQGCLNYGYPGKRVKVLIDPDTCEKTTKPSILIGTDLIQNWHDIRNNYEIRLCTFFIKGYCSEGRKCKFAHIRKKIVLEYLNDDD